MKLYDTMSRQNYFKSMSYSSFNYYTHFIYLKMYIILIVNIMFYVLRYQCFTLIYVDFFLSFLLNILIIFILFYPLYRGF
jgi:hypothetical protein